jgi:hypothetical protein
MAPKHVPFHIAYVSLMLLIIIDIFQEILKVVDAIGPEHVVHIVTDNESNYKKACKAIETSMDTL